MTTEQVSPIGAVWRHKSVSAVLIVCVVAAALAVAMLRPTIYTAEVRLAVGGNAGLAAESVPGYALASQELAANYARYVDSAQDQSALESHLGVSPGVVQQVSASPIPESNVVRVEVTARVASTARAAASEVGDSLMRQVNDTSRSTSAADATLSDFKNISAKVAAAQQAADAAKAALTSAAASSGADVAALSQQSAAAASQLAILQVQQDALGQKYRDQVATLSDGAANLVLVEKAVVTGDNRISQGGQFGLGGLVGGFLLAMLLSVILEKRRVRRGSRTPQPAPNGSTAGGRAAVPPLPALAGQGAAGPAERVG